MLRQLQHNLTELGQRWYAGDTAAVDEFLQLFCIAADACKALTSAPTASLPTAAAGSAA